MLRKKSKKFNRLHIEGNLKGTFFKRPIDFEIIFYFTKESKSIFYIYFEDINILKDKRLDLDFKIGDNIKKAKEWVEKKGHKIIFEKNR